MTEATELTGRRLLVAEDEPFIALDLQTVFERAGASVTVVPGIGDGLRRLDQGEVFDAALLDVRLVDGEVYPLAERLINEGVRIVFHSGHAVGRYLADTFPDAPVLSKPASPETLLNAVQQATCR